MRNYLFILLIGVLLGGALAYGLLPRRTEVRTEVVEKEIVKTVTLKDTTVTETRTPDGTITTRTEIKDKVKELTTKDTDSTMSKITERGMPQYFITGSYDLVNNNLFLGASRRILGPIWFGGSVIQPLTNFGSASKITAGVQLGVTLGF